MTASFQKPISLGSATSATTRSSAAPSWRNASSAAIAWATPAAPRSEPPEPAILFSPWSAIFSSVPNPRIHHRVRNVREEIERDRQDGDQHHYTEDHRVVAVDNGLQREQAHSGPADYA